MADPREDKGFLTANLEEDRRKMALEISAWKERFNIGRRFKAAVRENPWAWSIAAMMTGFVISLLPARKKEVYVWADPLERRSMWKTSVRRQETSNHGFGSQRANTSDRAMSERRTK
jgi:hypothetical protein